VHNKLACQKLSYPVRPNGPLKDDVKYATQACEEYAEETTTIPDECSAAVKRHPQQISIQENENCCKAKAYMYM